WVQDRLYRPFDHILRTDQLVYLDDEPVIWRLAFLAPPLEDPEGKAFLDRFLGLQGRAFPLAETFELIYGQPMGPIASAVEATHCDAATARMLGIAEGAAVLLRELLFKIDGLGTVAV